MTSPAPLPEPIRRYLIVQRDWDRRLIKLLKQASREVEGQLTRLGGRRGAGALVRSAQLRLAQREINEAISEAWSRLGNEISAGRFAARAEAIDVDREIAERLAATGLTSAGRQTMEFALRASARTSIELVRVREEASRIELSSRVYRWTNLSTGRVDTMVNSALARGLSARELAREAARFIRPDVPGGMSYAAMRLGRTELNNAFHAQTILNNQDYPWVKYMKWNLSRSHPKPDDCDALASRGAVRGLAGGTYRVEDVPRKPHPQCFCYVSPVTMSEDAFVNAFRRGEFNGWLTAQGF